MDYFRKVHILNTLHSSIIKQQLRILYLKKYFDIFYKFYD